jgi:hypothetical protein
MLPPFGIVNNIVMNMEVQVSVGVSVFNSVWVYTQK